MGSKLVIAQKCLRPSLVPADLHSGRCNVDEVLIARVSRIILVQSTWSRAEANECHRDARERVLAEPAANKTLRGQMGHASW